MYYEMGKGKDANNVREIRVVLFAEHRSAKSNTEQE